MKQKKLAVLIITIIGVFVQTAFYVVALTRYNNLSDYLLYYSKGLIVYLVVYVAMLAAITKVYGGFEIGIYRTFEIAFSQILSLTFVNLITYLQISLIAKEFLRIDYLLEITLGQYLFIALWSIAANRIYYSIFKPGRMLLIYAGDFPTALVEKTRRNAHRFSLEEYMSEEQAWEQFLRNEKLECEGVMICGTSAAFGAFVKQYCFEQNIILYIVPEISDIILHRAGQTELFDSPLLVCSNDSLTTGQEILKRIIDITVSMAVLLALSPMMAIIAIAIRLYDGGPVFYTQDRLTRDGKIFAVRKFRSMVDGAEKDGLAKLASRNDDRITPIGRCIRTIRFDEVPQFFNVLSGDMSVVGPRPERPEIAALYKTEIPEFVYRLKVKAGITGYAQVYGKYNTTPKDKLIMDIIYINDYSLLLDIKLILLTVKIIFLPGKSEGI